MLRILLFIISFSVLLFSASAAEDWHALMKKANDDFKNNNYKDAFLLYKKILLEHKASCRALKKATICLRKAKMRNEFDSFWNAAVKKYRNDPIMAVALAKSIKRIGSYGFIVAGKFVRGSHRGGGEQVFSVERDRAQALALLYGVLKKDSRTYFYNTLKDILMWNRDGGKSWRLQYLTDVKKLPDYEKREDFYYGYHGNGAPVKADGSPVFYHVPVSFEEAANDGKRWRWIMERLIVDKERLHDKIKLADFFRSQFGVDTIPYDIRQKVQSLKEGPYAVHLLNDDETIARLATGVRKIKLPADCNYIKIYKQMLDDNYPQSTLMKLAEIYKNRRQYVKSANMLKEIIRIVPENFRKSYVQQLNQITGNWIELLNCETFPAGVEPMVNLRFRNARQINCKLTKVNIHDFIADIKKGLNNNDARKELFRLGYMPERIGNWLLKKQGEKYLGKVVAEWSEDLQPEAEHFDKIIQLKMPVSDAGVYFLEVSAENGNTSRIIIWLSNTAIIERSAKGGKLYIVTDALTGKALDYCRIKFFGYKSEYIRSKEMQRKLGRRYNFTFNEFFTQTDANGMVFVEAGKLKNNWQFMIEANVEDYFGVLGFSSFYYPSYDTDGNKVRTKVYGITDCPIYKPGQTVNFNYWMRYVAYGKDNFVGDFAGKKIKLTVRSPRKKILEKEFTADSYGNFDSSFKLPEDADLGRYSIYLPGLGGNISFRVEEYRKPEYEVKVIMPKTALMLGGEIPVTVKAEYLFGAPVVNAKVRYKVYRSSKSDDYVPFFKWDWLYGRNSCSFAGAYHYRSWQSRKPTELVADNVGTTDAQGKLNFTIDTALANTLFNDEDSEYKISAEVTDSSRYTETGQGTVIASCQAFKVYCSTDKGFYRTGDIVDFSISSVTSDGSKVAGRYKFDLYEINYDKNREPVEKIVKSWDGEKDSEDAKIKFRLDKTGHYLAKVKVTDAGHNSISSELIIRVVGKGVTYVEKMTKLPLEIISDKKTYSPGDTASLMINTAGVEQNVYLFIRPVSRGMLNYAKLIKIPGSIIQRLKIRQTDMPNIFVEAVAVQNGKVYNVTKQIIVPPEKKILNIELKTDKNKYRPGQKFPLRIKITDSNGKAVSGDVVLTVYDKALDILSGGSNVSEINSFFWKWTRYFHIQSRSSLDKYFYRILKNKELTMKQLGIFGYLPSPEKLVGGGLSRNKGMLMESLAMRDVSPSVAPQSSFKQNSIVVRKNFADSILWKVALKTDKNGMAELPVPLPDNLTTWKIRAWAMTDKCSVGQGESEVLVSKDYLVRLIMPRFMNTGDTATISAIIMNRGIQEAKTSSSIEISGEHLSLLNAPEQKVKIGAQGEKRLDWQVRAFKAGDAVITVKSASGDNSDAVQLKMPVEIKGITKQVAGSGYIQSGKENAFAAVNIPEKIKKDTAELTINFSPSIATAMVDAIPYLIDTDDKDIFSTINRFAPALAAHNTLKKMGIDLADIHSSETNLNPVELGHKKERVAGWKRFENNPVFSNKKIERVVAKELKNIAAMQNSDGGWGWFSGFYERSYIYTTVRTVRALQLAAENAVTLDSKMLSDGIGWLKAWQERRIEKLKESKTSISNTDALVFDTLSKAGLKSDFMLKILYDKRADLSLNGLTLLALACQRNGDNDELKMLLENIEQFIVEDKENQTAYLRVDDSVWWCWYGRDIDTQAEYLKLLTKVDPHGKRAAWLAKYILINRKHATYWTSVVDTGLCVVALCEFVTRSGEAAPDMTVEIFYDGKLLRKIDINKKNIFNINNSIKIYGDQLNSGKHQIEFRRQGRGAFYFNTYLSYFTMEDSIKAAGLDLKVKRQYFKLVPAEKKAQIRGGRGQALEVSVEEYKRIGIRDFSEISSGDLIEIEFAIESKNDYEYIVIRDGKVAGFEPITALSGYTQNDLGAFVEMRNNATCFYVRRLARGKHSMSYRMRTVTPGKFTSLPTVAVGAYAPELRANSNEFSVIVK